LKDDDDEDQRRIGTILLHTNFTISMMICSEMFFCNSFDVNVIEKSQNSCSINFFSDKMSRTKKNNLHCSCSLANLVAFLASEFNSNSLMETIGSECDN
jgi:hypothetical protein